MSAAPPLSWITTKARQTLDPAQAANALTRLFEAWPESSPRLEETIESLPIGEASFLHLLAFSPAAGERLANDPDALLWLSQPALCETDRELAAMHTELQRHRSHHETNDDFALLRRQKCRETLRIALREISQCAPISQTAAEISHVAELCISEVFEHWNRKFRARWGDPDSQFAVIALGKFGGTELNFSSDIDVMFVYSEDGQLNPNFSYKEFFSRLATNIVSTFTEASAHGPLFRIDLRLRPDGTSGALVRSLESTENYYAAYGETWERMMLIKARPVAGDPELGYEFTQHLQPFVFPRHLTTEVLQEIAHVKHRIDTEYLAPGDHGREIKRGRGGIREIEFVVQSLQLLHGARHPFLQQTNTLRTIEALRSLSHEALLAPPKAAALEKSYCFLRTLEHRIQLEHDQQTHLLPETKVQRQRLATSLGFDSLASFNGHISKVSHTVRAIFENHFAETTDEVTQESLDLSCFASPDEANQSLGKLGADSSVSPRTRRVFRRLQPSLLEMLTTTVEPDLVLNRFLRFVENYGIRATLFELLVQHPGLLEWLTRLFDSTEFASEIAIRHPDLAEEAARGTLLDQALTVDDYLDAFDDARSSHPDSPLGDRLRLFRARELLRIALRDVLSIATIEEVLSEYTALAEACLVAAGRELQSTGNRHLTIIALGKLGARELSYGSDLDLVFVGDDLASAVAMTAEFARYSSEGPLYEIDTRLRPEGDSGPLVAPLAAYEKYFEKRAALWEAQALTKARPVCGPDADSFMTLARNTWAKFGERNDLFESIRHMLGKIHQHRGEADQSLDIKIGHGGIVAMEFAVQAHQMRTGLWETNTLRALDLLAHKALVPAECAAAIRTSYEFQRRILFILRRQHNRSVSSLPRSPAAQDKLARRLDFDSREAFWTELTNTRQNAADACTLLLN